MFAFSPAMVVARYAVALLLASATSPNADRVEATRRAWEPRMLARAAVARLELTARVSHDVVLT
jgi:hypothetical protein